MELMIPLNTKGPGPMYEQIYRFIKEEIRQGNLTAGSRLPSTRVLAENLKVSRSTTQMAYEQLLSEGYIDSEPCRGYYVAQIEELVEVKEAPAGRFVPEQEEKGNGIDVDFSPRGIDLDRFPFQIWRKISRNVLVDDNRALFLNGDPQGEYALRQAIGSYLHSARGVRCRPDQIIIGAGSEYLLMLLSLILGGDRVIAMENPTYKQAYRVFRSQGYQVRPVNMDRSGIMASELDGGMGEGADTVYVMPSHQYPMGTVMSVRRRQELLSWACAKEGRYLIEDDYDSEFRYKGKPIPALQGMDQNGRVIYIGTFSKSIAPAIRIGFLVLPQELRPGLLLPQGLSLIPVPPVLLPLPSERPQILLRPAELLPVSLPLQELPQTLSPPSSESLPADDLRNLLPCSHQMYDSPALQLQAVQVLLPLVFQPLALLSVSSF